MNTFGVYQTIYETSYLSSSTPSSISWIGSVQIFLLMFGSALTGPIFDAGHSRALIAVGSFLIVFGHMMLSLCTSYWQIILAQALCIGLGTGCLFVPAVGIIATYFNSRLALATGLAASGSSLGMFSPSAIIKIQLMRYQAVSSTPSSSTDSTPPSGSAGPSV